MSDELECFRKAAELGCPDFCFAGDTQQVVFIQDAWQDCGPIGTEIIECSDKHNISCDAFRTKRVARCAAAVCAEWWHNHYDLERDAGDPTRVRMIDEMIYQSRAFGKKYGGEK